MKNLKLIAEKMVADGKGILAADESTPTCTKRFKEFNLDRIDNVFNQIQKNPSKNFKTINSYLINLLLQSASA